MNLSFKNFQNSKKGLSALIAAVLLISFIVALLTVIISAFNENVIKECGSVEVKIKEIDGVETLCYSHDVVSFELDISKATMVNVEIEGRRDSHNASISVNEGPNSQTIIPYDSFANGRIEKVTFTPLTEKGQCPARIIIRENREIPECPDHESFEP